MTLYEIDQNLAALMDAVDPETGEWIGDVQAWESLSEERDRKLENTALFIKELRGDIAKFKAEIETLQKRMRVLMNKEAWLLENLRRSLDGQMFETPKCVVKFKSNPESVKYTDEKAVMAWAVEHAQECIKIAEPELSKAEIKKKLQSGTEIPGAELTRTVRMEVK
jgi:phage host-nuclease inhibitor protein Gam